MQGANLPDFCSLYKRNGKHKFDWKKRKFTNWKQNGEDMPFTVWMPDGLQERLMMWEAAKRSRGRVLCSGLGLGIYPQMALSQPRVECHNLGVLALSGQPGAQDLPGKKYSKGSPFLQ